MTNIVLQLAAPSDAIPPPTTSMTSAKPAPRLGDRDHRNWAPRAQARGDPDSPLRGGPVMTRRGNTGEVIYGETGTGKRRDINTLLIDDRRRHLGATGTYGEGIYDENRPSACRTHRCHFTSNNIDDVGETGAAPWRSGSPGLAAARRPGDDATEDFGKKGIYGDARDGKG